MYGRELRKPLSVAGMLGLSRLHNDISGVTGPDANGEVIVWLRNGWGLDIYRDDDNEMCYRTVIMTVPYRADWDTPPPWTPAVRPRDHASWHYDLTDAEIVDLLESMIPLDQNTPH